MAGSDWDDENPYASPRSRLDGPCEESTDADRDTFVVQPWIPSRDVIDVLLWLLVLALHMLLLVVPVWAVASLASYWWLGLAWPGFFVGATVLLLVYVSQSLSYVRHLRIDVAGIRFKRLLGKPKALTWEDIRVIRPAARRELVLLGWLRPLVTREPTMTFSARGHFRIEWAGGFCFFPPKDPAEFRRAVRRFRPDLLERGAVP